MLPFPSLPVAEIQQQQQQVSGRRRQEAGKASCLSVNVTFPRGAPADDERTRERERESLIFLRSVDNCFIHIS